MRIALNRLAVAGLLIAASGTALAQTGQPCDRACLLGIADAYFAALAAHDPSKAPLAPNVKFTEQTQVLKIWDLVNWSPTIRNVFVKDPGGLNIELVGNLPGAK